jgi:hypothetical protein
MRTASRLAPRGGRPSRRCPAARAGRRSSRHAKSADDERSPNRRRAPAGLGPGGVRGLLSPARGLGARRPPHGRPPSPAAPTRSSSTSTEPTTGSSPATGSAVPPPPDRPAALHAGHRPRAPANKAALALSAVTVAFGSIWVAQNAEGRIYRLKPPHSPPGS